jgi:hypothetical protein
MALMRRELGEAGREYVRAHLADTNAFCTGLLRTFEAEPGEVFTFAPPGTPAARLTQFEHGGLLPENLPASVRLPDGSVMVPVETLIAYQAELLHETMLALPGAVCIVDDYNRDWSNQDRCPGMTAFGVGEEVYHLLTRDHGVEAFAEALSQSSQIWHGVSAICHEGLPLNERRETTAAEIMRCAASAMLICCTAYDGEGFVVWRRATALGNVM